jgi:hypothetical protein
MWRRVRVAEISTRPAASTAIRGLLLSWVTPPRKKPPAARYALIDVPPPLVLLQMFENLKTDIHRVCALPKRLVQIFSLFQFLE